MPTEKTDLKITEKNPLGNEITTTVTYVSPSLTSANAYLFATKLNELTRNQFQKAKLIFTRTTELSGT